MTDDTIAKVSLEDMVSLINHHVRDDVAEKIFSIPTPLEGMCTLSAIIAQVVALSVDEESSAHHNIDEMGSFAKKIVSILIKNRDDKERNNEITKH